MTLTGEQLLDGFSRFLGDLHESTTTGAGTTTTLVDTGLTKFGDRRLEGWYIRITENINGNQYAVRRISGFSAATGTVTVSPAFAGATGSGTDYELHRYDPAEKFRSLDDARIGVFSDVFTVLRDDGITGDGKSTEFAIPTGMNGGPVAVYMESPLSPGLEWNVLTSPYMDSLTGWTASAGTAEIVQQDPLDPGVPKYDTACTKWTVPLDTAVTYRQVAADLSITPAEARGRRMVFAMWVYSRTASRVSLSVLDDTGAITAAESNTHAGKGWQLLYAIVDVRSAATSVLTVSVNVTSGAVITIYMNRAWFFLGDQLPLQWSREPLGDVQFDGSYTHFTTPSKVKRGWQLRVVGKAILSALGDTAATQVTNTMEVTEQTAQLLYCEAAGDLFRKLGLKVTDVSVLQKNMAIVDERRSRLRMEWQLPSPQRRIENPFR